MGVQIQALNVGPVPAALPLSEPRFSRLERAGQNGTSLPRRGGARSQVVPTPCSAVQGCDLQQEAGSAPRGTRSSHDGCHRFALGPWLVRGGGGTGTYCSTSVVTSGRKRKTQEYVILEFPWPIVIL